MAQNQYGRVAILYPGDSEVRKNATAENNRFADLFAAFAAEGIPAEPAVYHDESCGEVHEQLVKAAAVLVWANPIQDGRNRFILDAMLREVAESGVFVSAHPDIILKVGTKEVLYQTKDMGWGCEVYLYESIEIMRRELPIRLAAGKPRVLKQYRGTGGDGVWKVELKSQIDSMLRVRHAKRGGIEEEITLSEFFERCKEYFEGNGCMVDQEYQERLPEGMIRCYLVKDEVTGFGHQAINALVPAPVGTTASEVPQPGPRLYYPPTKIEFQTLKEKLENEWISELQRLLDIDTESLPILWDCDFLLGPKGEDGEDTYVLCEINVSSVAPYPESSVPRIVAAIRDLVRMQ